MAEEVAEVPVAVDTTAADSSGIVITRIGDQVIDNPEPTQAPAASQQPPAQKDPVQADAPATTEAVNTDPPPAPEDEEIEFFPYASEQTQGFIKSPEDVLNLYKEHQELKQKLAEKPKIEFPNEQARLVYEYAMKFPGTEVAAAKTFYHVQSLDLKSMDAKEKQFEAFALENTDLTREKARGYFEKMYERKYGVAPEEGSAEEFDHKKETQKAEESIRKMQEDFSKAPAPSQQAGQQVETVSEETRAAIKADAQKALEKFGGVKYELFDNDPNSVVNIQMEDSEVQQLESWMSDPKHFLEDLSKMCSDEKGVFSMEKLGMTMFEIKNMTRIRQQTFAQGVTYGKMQTIKELKNTAAPRQTQETTAGTPAKSFLDTFVEARNGKK